MGVEYDAGNISRKVEMLGQRMFGLQVGTPELAGITSA